MSEHDRSLAVSGASIVLALLIGYFGLRPLIDSYRQNQIHSAALAAQINDLNARKAQLQTLSQEFTKYQTQIDQLALAAPPAPDYPELLTQLDAIASKNQVTISSLLPGRNTDDTTQVPVTLTVRGNYPQLLAFAEGIEKNIRPINVSSMSFISANDTKQAQPLTATIQLAFARTASAGGGQ